MGYTFFIFSFFFDFYACISDFYCIFATYLQHDLMSDKVQLIGTYWY